MKFEFTNDIAVPVGFAYKYATDFEKFEAIGFGNMSAFEPLGDVRAPDLGARWKVSSEFQGRARRFTLQLRELVNNERMALGNTSEKFDVVATFEFTSKGPETTAFSFTLDAQAKTITARLIMQTLQLARGRIEGKIASGFERMATDMEETYRTTTTA